MDGTNTSKAGTSDASAIADSSHRGGGDSNGSSVGDSGLNGDRDLGAGSPWDLLGNRGAHLTGNLGALLNRHLDGDLDWDGVALLHRAGVAHLVDHGVGDGVADGGGPGATHGPGHLPGDGHTDGVGDLAGSLDSPGVAHSPGLSMAVGGRGVSSNKRGSTSSVSGSVESISLRLGISLTLGNTVVHQTSTITDSLNSSGNTDSSSSSSRGDSNASNSGSVSDNVGGVGNTDGSLGADLLGDVLAVLDGGGVDDGGDLVMALLLLNGFHVFIFKEVKNIQLIVVKKTRVSLLSPILRSTGNVCSPDGTVQPGCIAAQAPESNSLELKDSKL